MSKQTLPRLDSYQEFELEKDMLNGNICRICVTDNTKELKDTVTWAHERINRLYEYRLKELQEREDKKNVRI